MERTRYTRFVVMASIALSLAAMGCRASVAGNYELDLEETKQAVAKSAAENPDDAPLKDAVIKMLSSTQLEITLGEDGTMISHVRLTAPGVAPADQKRKGTWKLDNGRVVIKTDDDSDTHCDIDGKRLRCAKDQDYKLYGRYVLRRK